MDLDSLQSRFLALADAFPAQIEGLDVAAITGTKKLFGGDRTIIETTLAMTDDLHEHLGQLITYARMNGVVPPGASRSVRALRGMAGDAKLRDALPRRVNPL